MCLWGWKCGVNQCNPVTDTYTHTHKQTHKHNEAYMFCFVLSENKDSDTKILLVSLNNRLIIESSIKR